MKYTENRHPELSSLNIDKCYLCNENLGNDSTIDHIIPGSPGQIFEVNSSRKPCLPVHKICNDAKSKDDEFYMRHIQLACSNHPDAAKSFAHFLEKAIAEKPNAYLVGRDTSLRNYKIAKSLIDTERPAIYVRQKGQEMPSVPLKEENVERVHRYVQMMCKGLFVRNVPGSWPSLPRMEWMQYRRGDIEGKYIGFSTGVKDIIRAGGTRVFSQHWADRVFYAGFSLPEHNNLGVIFVELFGEVGYLAAFQV